VQVTPYILETVRHGKEAPKRTRVKKSRNHSRQNKRLTPPKLDFLQPKPCSGIDVSLQHYLPIGYTTQGLHSIGSRFFLIFPFDLMPEIIQPFSTWTSAAS